MPIDPSIALQYRGIQLEDPLNSYAKVAQIQNAQNQNAMSQYSLAKAQRDDQEDSAYRAALRGVDISNPSAVNNALPALLQASPTRAMALQKQIQEQTKQQADLKKTQAETQDKLLTTLGGALTAIHADPSDQNLQRTFSALQAAGIDVSPYAKVFMDNPDPQARRQIITSYAMTNKEGRAALEAFQRKIEYKNTGGKQVPVNTNPLAGPLGEVSDVAPLVNTQSPDSLASNAVARDRLAFDKSQANKPQVLNVEGVGPLVVDKNTATAQPVTMGGKPVTSEKSLTESQGKAAGLALRAQAAHEILNGLEDAGTMRPGFIKSNAAAAPLLGGLAGPLTNWTQSDAQQKAEQAQRDFVNAALRVESGASISQSEFENARKQYFPEINDSPAVIKQKRQAREREIQSLKVQAGSGAKKIGSSDDVFSKADAILGIK